MEDILEAKRALEEDATRRVKQAAEEIEAVLSKYRCTFSPMPFFDKEGHLRVDIRIEATQ